MRVAVYTIAKNEEQFVEKWAASTAGADYRLIVDTGSTDNTVGLARARGIDVVSIMIRPWRFDDARNASLALIPEDIDYCIALDMDEVLVAGWRDELERMHAQGVTRPRYTYTWSWKPDGTPDLQYGGDKIHARFGYRWKHPVHETLTPTAGQETQDWCGLEIWHFPDSSKSRGQYFPLLTQAASETPHDDRIAFYHARELFYHGMLAEAFAEFERFLALPTAVWAPERAAAYRFMAKCDRGQAEHWLRMATMEAPGRREAWVELSTLFYEQGMWEWCYAAASAALAITEKPLEYLVEGWAWGAHPHDMAAIAAYNLGHLDVALAHAEDAVACDPDDERLQMNRDLISVAMGCKEDGAQVLS